MKFIDLTHDIYDGMPAFTGDEPLSLKQTHSIPVNGYSNYRLTAGLHIGTHIDSPAHFLEGGIMINALDLNNLCGKACLLDARGLNVIDMSVIPEGQIPEGTIVVICTGYYRNFGKESYYHDYPVLDIELCNYFISRKMKMVCLDTPSPDKSPYKLHPVLFGAGITIVENLTNTESLLNISDFDIYALPLKIKSDGSPIRIVAQYDKAPALST